MFRSGAPIARSPCPKPGVASATNANSSASAAGPALPVLGQVNAAHLQVGHQVWVADAKLLWRIGEVQSIASNLQSAQVYLPDAADEKVQTLTVDKLFTFDASHIVDHDDIALMNNMHEAPLLNVLRQRFESDKIYTFTADILLSINPYKSIPLLYDVTGFMERQKAESASNSNSSSSATSTPHLFTIAEKAYAGMKGTITGTSCPQSIVISGESGAGKTEASKYIMKYLATASKGASGSNPTNAKASGGVHERIEECVVLSNLILESFGNAKTSRNDNSSRFGKYIQIHYNGDGRMAGVSIRHFLLEKTRLVMPQANERNYHIFYQLLSGLTTLGVHDQQKLKLQSDVWNYTYLTHGECVDIDGVDDAAEFTQLRDCLGQLGMDHASFQQPMFEILAVILQLGNVGFEGIKPENGANNAEEITTVVFPEADQGVDLEHVSLLLGVDPSEFAKKMVTQTTITGRGSILELKLSPEQAKNALNAFCKYLYGELFHHLIQRINACAKQQTAEASGTTTPSSMVTQRGKPKAASTAAFIGILDIFGFEVMKKNSLEQLCINFTNETLQQQFNKHVFVLEQERYAQEGIAFSIVEFKDNQLCLDLIQKPPMGLLPLLEEQMLLKRKTTDKQLLTIYHGNHLDKHANYAKPRFECDEFIIRHYAGEVTYDIQDFIAKNTDNLHDDLLDLLRRSAQPLLHAMFSSVGEANKPQKRAPVATSGPSNSKSKSASLTGTSTVSSRFRTQLTELMDVLWSTTPNYIKCIKPNNLKFPGGFSCELVRDQLIYSGVLEVVRIRQEGFPIRKRYDLFFERYWPLVIQKYSVATTRSDQKVLKSACECIAQDWLESDTISTDTETKKQIFAMGKQEIFLRYGQIEKLESFIVSLQQQKAITIQSKLVRCRLAFRKYQIMKRGMTSFQALWRMCIARVRYTRMRRAAVKAQAHFRRFMLQTTYQRQKNAANMIFRSTLRFLTHKRFVCWAKQTKAAVQVQRHVRGFLVRTAAERLRKLKDRSTLTIQCWYRMALCRRVFLQQRRASVRIQAEYRALVSRRAFLLQKSASVVLAAFIRQFLQRRKFKMLKQRIVSLQALVRQSRVRKQYLYARQLVVHVQSRRRQLLAKRRSDQRKRAVKMLQHVMRGWVVRCRYLVIKQSATRLQYCAKTWLRSKEYRQLRTSTKRVQRAWRRYARLHRWAIEVASLFGSQRANLAGSCTTSWSQHTKMEDSDRRMEKLRQQPALFFNLRPRLFGYNTLFHHAASCGDLHVVKYMLEQSMTMTPKQDLLWLRNGIGNTAFHEACANGQYDMAKWLLQQVRQIPEPVLRTVGQDKSASNRVASGSFACNQYESTDRLQSQRIPNKSEGPEQSESCDLTPRVVFSGYLRKKRETSRWMKRFVVLRVNEHQDAVLEYYANDKPATLQGKSAKHMELRAALFKKSVDLPFAFEIHSPYLLQGRNKEGRLYFAADNELEIQTWLAHLRHTIPTTIESRLFAMHRASKYGKLEFVDFSTRKVLSGLINTPTRRETPLHLAAGVLLPDANGVAPSLTPGNVSASVLTESEDPHGNNNSSTTDHHALTVNGNNDETIGSSGSTLTASGKARLDAEAELVKIVLWLIENGADVNAMTAQGENPLKRALQAKNLLVAKHLLDRGALAVDLTEAQVVDVQRLKAALAKQAISSVGCASSSFAPSASSSRLSVMNATLRKTKSKADKDKEMPLLFLLKQPGKIRHSSYVSVFVELIGIANPQELVRPRVIMSVLDTQQHLVEMKQQVSMQPLALNSTLLWSFTWHMQTPLENLPHGACVVFELTVSPLASATATTVTAAADDFVPVCWTYVQVDQRTTNCMPLNAEMYNYPLDLTLKKLQRVDAFLLGEVFISQGPHA